MRTIDPEEFLKSAVGAASPSVAKFANLLFIFDEVRDWKTTRSLLCEAVCAAECTVRDLAAIVAPSVAESVGFAWQCLGNFAIALPGWTVGEPPVVANRAIWLRDLLRELARFELPPKRVDALLWLAIHSGSYMEKRDTKFDSMLTELFGGASYNLGATGCDHVGRLLACELAKKDRDAENLLDTLRLVGTGRHPALSSDVRVVPSPHVARAFALCGREDAMDSICETIVVDRGDSELAMAAVVHATAAAVEALAIFPNVLPAVLKTIASELTQGRIDRESLAKQLASVLGLPQALLTQPTCDSILRAYAAAIGDNALRNQMIASNDDNALFLGFWAEADIDIQVCALQLLTRYEQACLDGREDIKSILRTFARTREGKTPAMRPMWLRLLKDSISDSTDQIDTVSFADAIEFNSASGMTLENTDSIPSDEALELLVEIERRLRNATLLTKLVHASPGRTSTEIQNKLIQLIRVNFRGRPGDELLRFVEHMDSNSIAVIVDADLSKTDIATRKAIFGRSSVHNLHGRKLMFRAVATAESTQELLDWLLEQRELHDLDIALFACACAQRPDRIDLWRPLLQASKKDHRELGLQVVSLTLKAIDGTKRFNESRAIEGISTDIIVEGDTIRSDVSLVLDEYEVSQCNKKNGDDLKSYLFLNTRELARSSSEVREDADKERLALARLCERVADMTGIDRSRFIPTPSQVPCDRGSRFSDILGEVAPKLLEVAGRWLGEIGSQSRTLDEHKSRFNAAMEGRNKDLREGDGSELRRANSWLSGMGDWKSFDKNVLSRANPLLSPDQLKRIAELRPPALDVPNIESLKSFIRSVKWDVNYSYDEVLLANLNWYESILANLPQEIQTLGPTREFSAVPHPPHELGPASVYMSVKEYLHWRRSDNQAEKENVRQRFWPLLWWTASFGGRVESIDATTIGSVVSSGSASLADLVWYLVQPDSFQRAGNLVQAVKYPDRICLGFNPQRDAEIRAVVDAVADTCRQQEQAIDPSLPETLANTWRDLPAPRNQNGLCDVLVKYSNVAYQTVGQTDDKQKAFADRLGEAIDESEKAWIVGGDYFAPKYINFEVLDAWLEQTTCELRKLFHERVVSDELLLRIAFDRPLLMRCILDATERGDQLEAAIWIYFHAGARMKDLAITLNSETGHASIRRSELSTLQIEQRFFDHYGLATEEPSDGLYWEPVEDATIRRTWKQAAIDLHSREKLEPMFHALKAVTSSKNRLRVEGLLDAMDGAFNSPVKRKALEASIKDRPNLAMLQLAVLPLPNDHQALVDEISQRLKVSEAMSDAGRKRKSAEAKQGMRRALDQFRRTLADNAGLSNPIELDWLSGEAIANELAEFERCEAGEYIVQLRLRSDGPHVLVSKAGKSLKSIPAAFKSSEAGKRLSELQSRLKLSLRDVRSVLEASMVQQRGYSPEELRMMMTHPVVASVARGLLFVMNSSKSDESPTVGHPSDDGKQLMGLDNIATDVSHAVCIAHPLVLNELGILTDWKTFFTDHLPQAFQQVDRAIVSMDELETAGEGKRVIRHDGVRIDNEDQAFRILQANGWHHERDSGQLCKTFKCKLRGEVTAMLADFMLSASNIGSIEFHGPDGNELAIAEVSPIILSEAIRDIDRTVSGTQG